MTRPTIRWIKRYPQSPWVRCSRCGHALLVESVRAQRRHRCPPKGKRGRYLAQS